MSLQNRKRQHLGQQKENGNGNELRAELKMATFGGPNPIPKPRIISGIVHILISNLQTKNSVLSESLAKVKVENEALEERLKAAEKKAKMAKNERISKLEEFISRQQKEEEQMELNLELEIAQNSLDGRHRVPLPLELNCQIFECLNFGIQRKFIGGLGRGIYGMFRHKVLKKSKRLRNPEQNGWKVSKTGVTISTNGLLASDNTGINQNVSAKKGFLITGELCRTDNFPGTVVYYFEVTQLFVSTQRWVDCGVFVGLSSRFFHGSITNSYGCCGGFYYNLSGKTYEFESFNGVNGQPEYKVRKNGNVIGCGLLLNPANELSIFFTGNGILMGKQIPLNSTVDTLYPNVSMFGYISVEANFGDDLAKPFSYDIKKCPGLKLM